MYIIFNIKQKDGISRLFYFMFCFFIIKKDEQINFLSVLLSFTQCTSATKPAVSTLPAIKTAKTTAVTFTKFLFILRLHIFCGGIDKFTAVFVSLCHIFSDCSYICFNFRLSTARSDNYTCSALKFICKNI